MRTSKAIELHVSRPLILYHLKNVSIKYAPNNLEYDDLQLPSEKRSRRVLEVKEVT